MVGLVGSTNGNAELKIHSVDETERALSLYLWYLLPWKGRNAAKLIESHAVLKGLTNCKNCEISMWVTLIRRGQENQAAVGMGITRRETRH